MHVPGCDALGGAEKEGPEMTGDTQRAKAMIHITDSDISEIRMMYRQAKYPEEQIGILADMYLCTKNDIRKVLGLPTTERQRVIWTSQMDRQMLRLRSEGKTNREIAELIGTTRESVRQRGYRLQAKAEKSRLQHGKLQAER